MNKCLFMLLLLFTANSYAGGSEYSSGGNRYKSGYFEITYNLRTEFMMKDSGRPPLGRGGFSSTSRWDCKKDVLERALGNHCLWKYNDYYCTDEFLPYSTYYSSAYSRCN